MHWMEKFYAYPTERTKNKNSEILAQLNKSVSRYLFFRERENNSFWENEL